jgi:cysteine desulfurase
MNSIYLDNNATTALDPAVRDEITPWLDRGIGNSSSLHSFDQEARRVLDKSRERVALLIGAQPEEIVLTSGGTEANNLALFGVMANATATRSRIVTTAVEHSAVLNPCRHIEKKGGSVAYLPVDRDGLMNAADARSSLLDDTLLASVMLADNEIGTIRSVGALSERERERGIPVYFDAVQAVDGMRETRR